VTAKPLSSGEPAEGSEVPHLRLARREEIGEILRESHGLWGAGLTYPAYLDMWLELMETPWAEHRFRYMVWAEDDGTVLSSLKLYRPVVRLYDRAGSAAVIGAVFTPRALRGNGHAADMIRAVLAEVREAGDPLAMLFSDIGTRYYEAFGFRALPAEDVAGRLDRTASPPGGWDLRPMTPDDLPAVIRAHDDACATRPVAMLRDREHWEFRYRVAVSHGRFAGYLVSLEGEGALTVREVGAPGADPGALSAILRLGGREALRCGLTKVHGWLPRDAAEWVPEWRLAHRPRRNAIPMLLPLAGPADLSALDAPRASFIP
jgi:predicted GNAT family acetyltransferase